MAALHRPAIPATRTLGRFRSRKALAVAGIMLVLAVALLQVHQFSRVTSTSYELNRLQRLRDDRSAENAQLEAEVARLSSLARIEWEARTRMNMQPAERRLYIDVNHPLPDARTLPTRFFPTEPARIAGRPDPFWKQALKLLPFF